MGRAWRGAWLAFVAVGVLAASACGRDHSSSGGAWGESPREDPDSPLGDGGGSRVPARPALRCACARAALEVAVTIGEATAPLAAEHPDASCLAGVAAGTYCGTPHPLPLGVAACSGADAAPPCLFVRRYEGAYVDDASVAWTFTDASVVRTDDGGVAPELWEGTLRARATRTACDAGDCEIDLSATFTACGAYDAIPCE